ncbi:hypothetical protein GA0061102_107130 [Rhizobium miluonense]|uniref:Uncharacterized protein n=1 Tax=Rhizobium miluonense TaxID=411945 RepID=A0A1C3XAC9_9HYPH|nr:hypothetical protein GA0061102_107130 [Rhizobium miluonense]
MRRPLHRCGLVGYVGLSGIDCDAANCEGKGAEYQHNTGRRVGLLCSAGDNCSGLTHERVFRISGY